MFIKLNMVISILNLNLLISFCFRLYSGIICALSSATILLGVWTLLRRKLMWATGHSSGLVNWKPASIPGTTPATAVDPLIGWTSPLKERALEPTQVVAIVHTFLKPDHRVDCRTVCTLLPVVCWRGLCYRWKSRHWIVVCFVRFYWISDKILDNNRQ